MFNEEKLKAAEDEAKRFLERAKTLRKELGKPMDSAPSWEGSQYRAAVKRASMDLTRALADLRR